jgi:hypothetical protein
MDERKDEAAEAAKVALELAGVDRAADRVGSGSQNTPASAGSSAEPAYVWAS